MSTLTLYRTHLTPSKNALVDELSTYLADRITYGPVDIQYQKPALDLAIKLTIPQAQLTRQDIGNYAALKQDNMTFYYFIMSAAWKSANTVEVTLSIDSINTFNGYIRFSDKTTVIRQHENRFKNIQKIVAGEQMKLYRNVDNVDEGVTPIKLKASDTKIVESDTRANQNWYLVYRTPDIPTSTSPVDCFLVPEKADSICYSSTADKGVVWNPTDFDAGVYYYWLYVDNPNCFFVIGDNEYYLTSARVGYIFYHSESGLTIYSMTMSGATPIITTSELVSSSTTISIKFIVSDTIRRTSQFTADLAWVQNYATKIDLKASRSSKRYLQSIQQIDRTQSTLVKIIDCPYCPINLNFDSDNVLIVPTSWVVTAGGYLKLSDLNAGFSHTLSNVAALPLQVTLSTDDLNEFKHQARDIKYESKLYNSAFYTYKFVYDSFSTELQLENITGYTVPLLSVQYKQACTITSDCGFKIDSTSALEYKNTGDYDMYILSTRNNESPIYTSEYLDYIRTGYNYDRKNQNLNTITTWVGAGISLIGAAASFAASGATSGLSMVAAISLTTTALATITNGVSNTVSAERSIQQKIDEAKAQATQVSSANDVDLLNWYSGNKLHIMTYQATDKMRNQLWDLFHYCGYGRNIQEKPNFTSRYWFNYVQCNLDDADVDSNPILNNYVDDIKSRWSAGVTVYHCHDGEYDWAQQYENWETAFIN